MQLKHCWQEGDSADDLIRNKKNKIRYGASKMMEEGVIDENEYEYICAWVDNAPTKHYQPYLYIIPAAIIEKERVHHVSPMESARPWSEEYQIKDLASNEFDIIQF